MAACELRGELKYRNGEKKEFVVKTENNLKDVLAGVQKMNADVSAVLTELVLREKGSVKNGKGAVQVDGLIFGGATGARVCSGTKDVTIPSLVIPRGQLFSSQPKHRKSSSDDEEEDDSDEEDEKEIQDGPKASSSEPPAKRTKTLRA